MLKCTRVSRVPPTGAHAFRYSARLYTVKQDVAIATATPEDLHGDQSSTGDVWEMLISGAADKAERWDGQATT